MIAVKGEKISLRVIHVQGVREAGRKTSIPVHRQSFVCGKELPRASPYWLARLFPFDATWELVDSLRARRRSTVLSVSLDLI